jgi:hypothetical protein
MKSRVILAAGMLMLASALGRAEEKPPVNDQQQPAAAPAPAPPPAVLLHPAAVPGCRPACHDPCQRFQDWLAFCPQHTPCCGHCDGCGCTPACPPLYTYFLDHCGYHPGHGCGCATPPPHSFAPHPVDEAPCATCCWGWWHRLLGH